MIFCKPRICLGSTPGGEVKPGKLQYIVTIGRRKTHIPTKEIYGRMQ